jgi:hypothetical protein
MGIHSVLASIGVILTLLGVYSLNKSQNLRPSQELFETIRGIGYRFVKIM